MKDQPESTGPVVLVPRKPTEAMLLSVMDLFAAGFCTGDMAKGIITAVLDASPFVQARAIRTIKPFYQDPSEYVSLEDHQAYVAQLHAEIQNLNDHHEDGAVELPAIGARVIVSKGTGTVTGYVADVPNAISVAVDGDGGEITARWSYAPTESATCAESQVEPIGDESKGPLCFCGLRQTKNPHPEAGVPPGYLEVGTVYDCIPCLNKSRRAWSKRANAAQGQVVELQKRIADIEAQQCAPVAVVNEGDEGLFAEFIYGEDGSPLKRGDKLYLAQPVEAKS